MVVLSCSVSIQVLSDEFWIYHFLSNNASLIYAVALFCDFSIFVSSIVDICFLPVYYPNVLLLPRVKAPFVRPNHSPFILVKLLNFHMDLSERRASL